MGITQTITSGILNEEPWISYSSVSKGVITSSLILGAAIGCFIGGAVLNKFGRKLTLTISTIFIFLFGILCGFFGNIYCLLIFRMICGLGVGLAKIAAQLFITEVAQIINIDENAKTREEYSSVKTEQEKLKEFKKKKKEMKMKFNKKKSGDAFRERIMAVDQTSITFGILLANIIKTVELIFQCAVRGDTNQWSVRFLDQFSLLDL
ncbi:MAG: hypothetical protein EZS28_011469 [Streblomastix strix]|uniref:Major facilitator superfamily (MFS) profile domain-containing protein n=1 Tax=Streblomastix strix TaxID=222440 RepID=A0A5J4WDD6_9EUKA|nr:MAG: hypothetical protein EZS28_011469 [Streblomastix strix]